MGLRRITFFFITLLIMFFNISQAEGASATATALLDVDKGRTYVPIRFVTEQFGAEVIWNGEKRTVLINNKTKTITLKIGEQTVEVNKQRQSIDAPPFIKDNITYVPLRFVSTMLGTEPVWNAKNSTVKIEVKGKDITLSTIHYNIRENALASKQNGNPISVAKPSFKVGSKIFSANVVTIDLKDPSIDLKVGLAKNQVGQVESLASIAKRNNAAAAINGSYFDANTKNNEPHGIIIVDGEVVHISRERTVFSFNEKNNVNFSVMDIELKGSTNGSDEMPNNWYAYWLNRTPEYNAAASVVIFTPAFGESIGFTYGTNVIVENGKVKEIVPDKDVKIPSNGFVINLMGTEVHSLLSRFIPGTSVDFKMINPGMNLKEIEGAIGAGPRLLTNGKISIVFDGEGFNDNNFRTASAQRSAVGVTKDEKLIFVTTASTIVELAEIMKKTGAYQAMNLDGGASSGLYYNGNYVKTPGQNVSNAILVIKK